MAAILAEDAKLYRNTGTFASPTWTEICNVMDLTLSLEQSEVEVTRRCSGGFRDYLNGLIDAGVEFKMLYDNDDAAFTAFQDAFFNKTNVEVAVMDGDITTSGNEGLRAVMMVRSFTRNESLGEALNVDVSLKPVVNTENAGAHAPPTWYEVP